MILEPSEVQRDRRATEEEAQRAARRESAAAADKKTKMKGKNRPSKRHRKKQTNIIDERKGGVLQRIESEKVRGGGVWREGGTGRVDLIARSCKPFAACI